MTSIEPAAPTSRPAPVPGGLPVGVVHRERSGDYTAEERRLIVEHICERVAEGGIGNTFKQAAIDAGLSRGAIFRWTTEDKDLKAIYDSARIWQAHSCAEDMLTIADEAKPDDVHVRRLQVDARKFYVAKIAPKIYGDKLELSGPNGIPLLPPPATRFDLSRLTLEQLEQWEALAALATVPNFPLEGAPVLDVPAPAPKQLSDGVTDGRP